MKYSKRTQSLTSAGCSIGLSCFMALVFVAIPAQTREFRAFNPVNAAVELPGGARPVENLQPVAPELVQKAVGQLMANWATPEMQAYLSKDFYDKDRLEDVIDTLVPRDAKVRILSVQGIQTLQQHEEAVPGDPAATQRVSRVSVVVRTALEYNDSDGVLVQLPGTTEYILSFREMTGGYQR